MGSATNQALVAARRALGRVGGSADLTVARELFAAARIVGDSAQLRSVLSDPSTDSDRKALAVQSVFGGKLSGQTLSLLTTIATQRWSSQNDLLAGIEEIGTRVVADSAPSDVSLDTELLAFGDAVSSNAELELALRSKLASPDSKAALVRQLLAGKASEQTVALVDQLVSQPRGRSIRVALRDAAAVIANQAGLSVATVTSAQPIATTQLDRLRSGLSRQYARDIRVNQVIDPSLIGGLRVQVGDDVIDSSVATRIKDVRLQLAR